MAADCAGRVLAAANQALPRPDQPHLALWQAATTLREHRGDGHIAALVARGISPVASHLIKAAAGESDPEVLRTGRKFDEAAWAEGAAALRADGVLTADGQLTDARAAPARRDRGRDRRGRGRAVARARRRGDRPGSPTCSRRWPRPCWTAAPCRSPTPSASSVHDRRDWHTT